MRSMSNTIKLKPDLTEWYGNCPPPGQYDVYVGDEKIATLTPEQFGNLWFRRAVADSSPDCRVSIELADVTPINE
jgi:hypothetical protein